MMLVRYCAVLCVIVWAVSAAPAQPPADASQNAALRYWHAFDALGKPELEVGDYLDPQNPKPLDAAARKLLDERKTALLYLRRGAAMPFCDWGLHLEDGPALLLPHLQKSRDLGRLGCLSMRRHFEEGRPAEAVEDLVAVLTLARHLGADQTIIAMLVQFVIESVAYQAAGPYLNHLDAKALRALSGRIDKLPPAATLRRSIELENEHMIGWLIKRIKEGGKLAEIVDIIVGEDKTARQSLLQAVGEKSAIKQLEDLQKDYDALAKALALPRAEQPAKVEELQKKMEANPFGKLLMPAIGKVQAAEDRIEVRRTLFKAALALAAGGPDAVRPIKDPASDGPFEVQKLPPGFELRSKLLDKEKPISLKVGTAKN